MCRRPTAGGAQGGVWCGMKKTRVLLVLAGMLPAVFAGAGLAWQPGDVVFDRTGRNISFPFRLFMRANTDGALPFFWSRLPGARQYLYDNATADALSPYHFILVPGGEFDAASELVNYCETGEFSFAVEHFFEKNPTVQRDVEKFLQERICPEPDLVHELYNNYMGSFKTYERFFAQRGIACTRLDYFAPEGPSYVGDRIGKLDLIADTIDALEARSGGDGYILVGHSFGGLNICDFLVELLQGHAPGTPEWKFFARTKVRAWPAEKKDGIFKKIKAAVLLNTFIQGDHMNDRQLRAQAVDDGAAADPVQQAIDAVLEKGADTAVTPEEFAADADVHLVLISARYRSRYYLTGLNSLFPDSGQGVRAALAAAAESMPVLSVCCMVPKYAPYLRAGFNLLAYQSTVRWRSENLPNDGQVDTYGGIFPVPSAEYIVFNAMDHGTLVMNPEILWITTGGAYDQLPFLRTLLKRVESRLQPAE